MRQVARRATIGIESYRPSYHVSSYRRPLIHRLTPLTWFVIALALFGLLGGMAVIVHRVTQSNNGTELLADRLYGRRSAGVTSSQAIQATPLATLEANKNGAGKTQSKQAAVAAVATAVPTPAPTAAPTADPNRAPWADQLEAQRDGTLLAPKAVVDQASADLSAYYAMQRDLPIADFLARRDEILATYFSGPALEAMRQQESQRKQYEMNRAGHFSVQVRDFAADGLSAKAGIITRGWTNDVYDVATKRLRTKGKVVQDTFSIITIRFDRGDGRWKFDAVEEAAELEP